MKICIRCNENLPESGFSKSSAVKSGLRGHCRNCQKIEFKKWYVDRKTKGLKRINQKPVRGLTDKEIFEQANPHLKWCARSKHYVDRNNFNKSKGKKDGLAGICRSCVSKEYEANKEKVLSRNKAYRAANKEKIKQSAKLWVIKNKDKSKKIKARYRDTHRDDLRVKGVIYFENNKEKYKRYQKTHRQRRPDLYRTYVRNRRSLRDSAKGFHTKEQWQEKLKFYNNCCYLCGKSFETETPQAEHRIPLSRGGTNWISNIAPACSNCNLSKGYKTEKEFKEHRAKMIGLKEVLI